MRTKVCRFCGIYEDEHDRDHLASVCYPQQIKELNDFKNQYFELIMTVTRKFPTNETRHQTALRYIREAEEQKGEHVFEMDVSKQREPYSKGQDKLIQKTKEDLFLIVKNLELHNLRPESKAVEAALEHIRDRHRIYAT